MRYKTYRRKLARTQLGLISTCLATHYDRCPASGRTTTLGVDELTNRRGSPVVNVSMMWKTLGRSVTCLLVRVATNLETSEPHLLKKRGDDARKGTATWRRVPGQCTEGEGNVVLCPICHNDARKERRVVSCSRTRCKDKAVATSCRWGGGAGKWKRRGERKEEGTHTPERKPQRRCQARLECFKGMGAGMWKTQA